MTEFIVHAKVRLALHTLRDKPGPSLLLLHGLGERSPKSPPAACEAWPGAIYALDFCGHGASTVPNGGGYTSEVLMADADAALRRLGSATICGRGLGSYIALLLAGARPDTARGTILLDGPGLSGGGARPGTPVVVYPAVRQASAGQQGDASEARDTPDPFAMIELARDLRPPDYATAFVRQASQLSDQDRPISVCARERPDWLLAVLEEPGVEQVSFPDALRHYAETAAA